MANGNGAVAWTWARWVSPVVTGFILIVVGSMWSDGRQDRVTLIEVSKDVEVLRRDLDTLTDNSRDRFTGAQALRMERSLKEALAEIKGVVNENRSRIRRLENPNLYGGAR